MERYDGKTRKDDYKKYALIAAGVVALIVAYKLVTWGIYRLSHPAPDLTVVLACERVLDFDAEDTLESELSACIPDLDGNGKTVVDVVPLHLTENEAIKSNELDQVGAKTDIDLLDEYFNKGTYRLFLLSNRAEGQPAFSDYVGMQSAVYQYCNGSYCRQLPDGLADENNPYCAKLTGVKMLEDIGWGQLPFYGCIQKDASEEEYELAVSILRQMKDGTSVSDTRYTG